MSKVFVITGPSGVGKGTLIAKLLERVPGLELSVSATTREPREGEVDGRDYHFLSREQFDERVDADDFLEFATYSGNRYGTLRSEVRRRLDEGASVAARDRGPGRPPGPGRDARVGPGLHRARRTRPSCGAGSKAAAPTPTEAIDSRLEVAEQELAAQDEFAYRIVNDDLEQAAADLEGIVRAELGIPLDSPAE